MLPSVASKEAKSLPPRVGEAYSLSISEGRGSLAAVRDELFHLQLRAFASSPPEAEQQLNHLFV